MASLAAFAPVTIGARAGRVARRAQRDVTRACVETEVKEPETVAAAPAVPQALFGQAKTDYLAAMPGVSGPLGVFDIADLANGKTSMGIKRLREAELTHGRVGMLGCVGVFIGEKVASPFTSGPAAHQFEQLPFILQMLVFGGIGYLEYGRATTGWVPPQAGELWALKEDYEAGNLGFDPLGLKPTNPTMLRELKTKELNNGRLAMLGLAGMIAQECVTGQSIF